VLGLEEVGDFAVSSVEWEFVMGMVWVVGGVLLAGHYMHY
jgi:hypothetical protein